MKKFVALTIFPLNQLTFFNKSSSLNLHPIFFLCLFETGLEKPEKNLTGYGYGLERKIKNSFGYITGYEF